MQIGETASVVARDKREFSVRRLVSGDAEALKLFNDQLTAPSRRFFLPHAYDTETLTKAIVRSEAGEDLLLGLFDGGRLIGYFFLWYYSEPVPLLGVGLLDDYHGLGLGRGMIAFLIAQAESADKEGIELTTMVDNTHAYALYKQLGFVHYSDVKNLQGNGNWVIEHAMFYRIKPGAEPMQTAHQPPV